MENTRISTTGSFPDELNASKLIMRPEQVAEEHFDPCLVQMDCRYDEAPLREFVRVPENESPRPEQVAEEHFDPCLVQMDCRYDEAPLREFVRVPENESPHPQAGVRNRVTSIFRLHWL